jgi:hypothetical protein
MKRIPFYLCSLVIWAFVTTTQAQRIQYTEPEREDSRNMDFEVVGKVSGNVLVYKNVRTKHAISVYDTDMKLKERVNLEFVPDRIINIDFVVYAEHIYAIYQYQRKDIVYCMGIKLDGNAKALGDPFEMDTTRIGFAANNKIYTIAISEDRQRILVFKINTKSEKNFYFTTLLYDANLQILHRSRLAMPMAERNDFFTDFAVDNEGDMIFGKYLRNNSNDYITKVLVISKPAMADSFAVSDLGIGNHYLDDIKIKIDNLNKRYLFNALYYKSRRGSIEGLYTAIWDKAANKKTVDAAIVFNDELRTRARASDASFKTAFNDYYIRHIVPRKDGGFILAGECLYTTTRGNPAVNRWDLGWGSPFANPGSFYYTPYSYNYYAYGWAPPWGTAPGGRGFQTTRYYAENVLVISVSKDGTLEWSNVISKNQFDDDADNLISYQMVITGGQLHFLFNQSERRNLLLNDHSLTPDGQITRNPTLKNLDKGYDFLARYGKQIGARQIVMPCFYRNYLCFAKIDF